MPQASFWIVKSMSFALRRVSAFAATDYAGRRVGVLESTVVLNSGDDGRLGPIVAIEVECEIVDIG